MYLQKGSMYKHLHGTSSSKQDVTTKDHSPALVLFASRTRLRPQHQTHHNNPTSPTLSPPRSHPTQKKYYAPQNFLFFFFFLLPPPPDSTLFPYPTLFRPRPRPRS